MLDCAIWSRPAYSIARLAAPVSRLSSPYSPGHAAEASMTPERPDYKTVREAGTDALAMLLPGTLRMVSRAAGPKSRNLMKKTEMTATSNLKTLALAGCAAVTLLGCHDRR